MSRAWSMPQRWSIVACRSRTWTTSSTALVAELVGGAVGHAPLDAAAGHPEREAEDVVVAAGPLAHRRAAELAAPEDQRVVEHPALLRGP